MFVQTPASELPSASPLYTWRALRLLGSENPANLVGCYDGDLVKVCLEGTLLALLLLLLVLLLLLLLLLVVVLL